MHFTPGFSCPVPQQFTLVVAERIELLVVIMGVSVVVVGFAGIGVSSRLVCLDKLLQFVAVLSISIYIKTVKKIDASTTFDTTKTHLIVVVNGKRSRLNCW